MKKNIDADLALEKYLELGTVRKTASYFDVNHRTMSKILKNAGATIKARILIDWIDNEHIRCSKCFNEKHISLIVKNKNSIRNEYYQSFCWECRSKETKAKRLGKDQSFNEKVSRIMQSAKKSNVDFALKPNSLEFKWNWQEGRCFYTDVPLSREMGRGKPMDNAWSIDRVVPEKGYVFTNIVICSNKANRIKSDMTMDEMKVWMPVWYERLEAAKFGFTPSFQPADKMSDWWKHLDLNYGPF